VPPYTSEYDTKRVTESRDVVDTAADQQTHTVSLAI